jgi:hypothetical protein
LLQEPRLSRAEGTYALVLSPTRELCLQIEDVAVKVLRRYHWLVSGQRQGLGAGAPGARVLPYWRLGGWEGGVCVCAKELGILGQVLKYTLSPYGWLAFIRA